MPWQSPNSPTTYSTVSSQSLPPKPGLQAHLPVPSRPSSQPSEPAGSQAAHSRLHVGPYQPGPQMQRPCGSHLEGGGQFARSQRTLQAAMLLIGHAYSVSGSGYWYFAHWSQFSPCHSRSQTQSPRLLQRPFDWHLTSEVQNLLHEGGEVSNSCRPRASGNQLLSQVMHGVPYHVEAQPASQTHLPSMGTPVVSSSAQTPWFVQFEGRLQNTEQSVSGV
mmetsp:Transcript_31214/g.67997  ORF Transcript_31214/g.67997 Transcript_31214/m.67997 type:complete len:219 (-) Transcript_31214:339-995(-)